MKILITGATGFIGNHLIKHLTDKGYEITAIIRKSTNTAPLVELGVTHIEYNDEIATLTNNIIAGKFDGVIHLASLFLAQHKSEDIQDLIGSNILFGTVLLEASVRANIPWFINTGSIWQHFEHQEYNPVNLYAATKQAFEDIIKHYAETSHMKFATIQLGDTFGPHDTRQKVFNIWNKTIASKEYVDMSAGEQIIDMNYIGNIIDGYQCLIDAISAENNSALKKIMSSLYIHHREPPSKILPRFSNVLSVKKFMLPGVRNRIDHEK